MVRHNNVIPDEHFRKKWDRRVKTWFHQPIQKKIRREKRRLKAAKIAPRPASGLLKPLVHGQTQKYNSKLKLGRGFTLEELKEAKINRNYAKTIGIAVDHRRTNKSTESLNLNVARLQEYISRLLVFPRGSKVKNGDCTFEEAKAARQLKGAIIAAPALSPAVTKVTLTEELTAFKAYSTLRAARNDAKLVGIRKKKASEKKDEAPAKSDD
eukprot:gene19111-24945_t